MVGRKRTTATHPPTPYRFKKRCATRITATPRHVNRPAPRLPSRAALEQEEEIETTRDDYWALPLPTSPAPSPPRPKEICPRLDCSLVATSQESQVFTYRKLYDEKDQTLRDALGRETAGRHSIPAREFTRDRFYMTPSTKAKEAHGIEYWPAHPFQSVDNPAERDQLINFRRHKSKRITVALTPPSREPTSVGVGVHTTGRKQVALRPFRLFSDENEEGNGGVEGDNENEDDAKTLRKEKEDTVVYTAIGAQGDMVSTSRSRKRRASKTTLRYRRCLYAGSVKSDGVRTMTSSDEEGNLEDNDVEEREKEVSDGVHSDSGDLVMREDEGSGEGDLNRTLEEEKEESDNDEDEEESGSERMEEDDGTDEMMDGSEETEEDVNDRREEREDNGEEMIDERDPVEDYDNSDAMEKSVHNRSSTGDISLIDNTLPLESVVHSIKDEDLRRMLACCKQKNVIDMAEFMYGVDSAVKVGEGSFADAYLVKRKWEEEKKVFKIIALKRKGDEENELEEEDEDDNSEKKEEDAGKVFGEVVISKDLTRLGRSGRNSTNAFAKLYRARVIQGIFPDLLSAAWETFNETDDDAVDELNPVEYGDKQLFLVLECEYGGLSLNKFPFSSIVEIISVYCQTALALAVAESEFKFEHRDLHEDNVLVKRTEDTVIEFTYDCNQEKGDHSGKHKSFRVPTHGVKTTIIDFTLSRITRKPARHSTDDIVVYHELTTEQCNQDATAEQYVVYNKMEKLTKGDWEMYTPKSNVLWLRMQINWIIANNLNPKSKLNVKRLKASKSRRIDQGAKKQPKRQSMKKSLGGEEERMDVNGKTWIKKIKEGASLITKLEYFAEEIDKFDSAEDVVTSEGFKNILALLQ